MKWLYMQQDHTYIINKQSVWFPVLSFVYEAFNNSLDFWDVAESLVLFIWDGHPK